MPPANVPEQKSPNFTEIKTPGSLPIDVNPKPAQPAGEFPPPASIGTASPTGLTKTAGSREVKPVVPELAPQTTYDVDLHYPKANDSYESISKEFYNDPKFAQALQTYNKNKPLTDGSEIKVPPIYVLRKQFPKQTAGAVTPVGASSLPPSSAPQWTPTTSQADVPARPVATTRRGVYVVPQSGMTMKDVARVKLGSEQRWPEVYDLNPDRLPLDKIPQGTEIKVPTDARP